jgi:hypothetical protein
MFGRKVHLELTIHLTTKMNKAMELNIYGPILKNPKPKPKVDKLDLPKCS